MDLKSMSDEEFEALRLEVANDYERRENLKRIPEQISELTKVYVNGGGSIGDLMESIESDYEPV